MCWWFEGLTVKPIALFGEPKVTPGSRYPGVRRLSDVGEVAAYRRLCKDDLGSRLLSYLHT
jgi:hypothetical protein